MSIFNIVIIVLFSISLCDVNVSLDLIDNKYIIVNIGEPAQQLKFYVDNWYEYIEKENIELLEKEIGMSFKDFVIEILGNVYNEYKDIIRFIPVSKDNCSEYIIKPQNGRYSLEDFLIASK